MLQALISLGGLGFVVSVVLAIAYARLAIKLSLKQKQIIDALPGANCGACGYPGCEGYAGALSDGKADVGQCPVGGQETLNKVSKILGVEAAEVERKVAVLMCCGDNTKTYERMNYVGIFGCEASNLLAGGQKSCIYGCLGFGDCVKVCKFDAIKMGDRGLPIIADNKCTGCGACVFVCPRNILELISKDFKVYVGCNSPDSAKVTKSNCKIGCIGCGLCDKNCPYDAIKVVDGRARINFEGCQNCGICVFKCPTHTIVDKLKARPKAMIGVRCTGCERCKEACVMKAIEGEFGEQHKVIFSKCIGCGLCQKVCEPEAITIAFSLGYSEV